MEIVDKRFIHLNRNSALPLYYQLKEHIKEAIVKGHYKENDKLPTEEELCNAFDISRPVVRKAYDELIKEGVIDRYKGKGTFVRSQDPRESLMKEMLSFSFEKNIDDLEKHTKIVKINKTNNAIIAQKMGLTVDKDLLHIIRIAHDYECPKYMLESYIPLDLYKNIESLIFNCIDKPVIDVIESFYGIPFAKAKRTLEALELDEEKREFLAVKEHGLAYEVETKYVDELGRITVLEYASFLVDRTKITVDIKRKY